MIYHLLALLLGCTGKDGAGDTAEDADADGYPADADCDDDDPAVHPGAAERCDDVDNDCDGAVDGEAEDASTWYADADGDSYGDGASGTLACTPAAGQVADATDCDDTDAGINPGAAEACGGGDEDCDGSVDVGAVDATAWFADVDADGFGDPTTGTTSCAAPAGTVADQTDCDDANAAVNTAAVEVCNGIDDDCEGTIDQDAADPRTWFGDADADGYGDPAASTVACDAPPTTVADGTDCDDTDASFHPGAAESCTDPTDYNCDGSTGYADVDLDGTAACEDCDDTNAAAHPGGTEVCDSADNDCNGDTDEATAVDASSWYADTDGDGHGDAGVVEVACEAPTTYVSPSDDCDDTDPTAWPGAVETCDDVDDDCDGSVDEDAADATMWFVDADGDGHGESTISSSQCDPPAGYAATSDDCDDADAARSPSADEVCGGGDDDCDGLVDAADPGLDLATQLSWYTDTDGDGYGDTTTAVPACDAPAGTVAAPGDCDETSVSINPGRSEQCDAVDEDCDGVADNGLADCVDGIDLPPDPSDEAPAPDVSVAGNVSDSVAFLYTDPDPVQTGVDPDDIDPVRAGVVRGRVLDGVGDALGAVTVSILDHPELGETLTRADGEWDLVVNGGTDLTVVFARSGWLTAQRHVDAEPQGWAVLDDVVLLETDVIGTDVALDGSGVGQVAEGSEQTDVDGTRQAVVFFPPGITAQMLVEGVSVDLPTATVRATEYTVGELGPAAMPGDLPASSAYTYAVELSADEAEAAGATSVQFSGDVSLWVTNFLSFPVGSVVPFGWYDREEAAWIPSDDGIVIEILGTDGSGYAEIDIDGTGVAASSAELVDLGFSDEERIELGTRYAAGDQLWRVMLDHFTPTDCNWPYDLPSDSEDPPDSRPDVTTPVNTPCRICGSIVEPENMVLREVVPVAGTPLALVYSSDRVPGYQANNSVTFDLTDGSVPTSLEEVVLELEIAGQLTTESYTGSTVPTTYTYTWDGLDAYGRTVQGGEELTIRIRYEYGAVYVGTGSTTRAFGSYGDTTEVYTDRSTSRISLEQTTTVELGAWNAESAGLGRWSVDVQHAYDPGSEVLYLGNGGRLDAQEVEYVGRVVAGTGSASCADEGFSATEARLGWVEGVAVSPEGVVYFSDQYCDVVWRVGEDGLLYRVAGTGVAGSSGDGGDPRLARLFNPAGIDLDAEGSLYIADTSNESVRKVTFDEDGVPVDIETVAGGNGYGFSGDGGVATDAMLCVVTDVDVDDDGSIYLTEDWSSGSCGYRVRRVDPAGIIETFAGSGSSWYLGQRGDGGQATSGRFCQPQAVDVGPEGTVYIADSSCPTIRTVDLTGEINTYVGSTSGSRLEGSRADGYASTLADLDQPYGLAVDSDGRVFFADADDNVIRRVETDGTITTIAGDFDSNNNVLATAWPGDGTAARAISLATPRHLDVTADGSVYYADFTWRAILALEPPFPSFDAEDILIAQRGEIDHFDSDGLHLYTYDAVTGVTRYSFGYTTYGDDTLLTSVTDAWGAVTTITRSADGTATAITSPDGLVTTLSQDSAGTLATITDPSSATWSATYDADGLIQSFESPGLGPTTMTWDDEGQLLTEVDAVGGSKTLVRSGTGDDWEVAVSTAEGLTTTFGTTYEVDGSTTRMQEMPDGRTLTRSIAADGSVSETLPDGTTVETEWTGDPRFGMQDPYASSIVRTTPGGVASTLTREVEASLSDPSDRLSLTSLVDTLVLDGDTLTSELDVASATWTQTTEEGRVLETVLDATGAPVRVAWGSQEPVVLGRDSRGRITTLEQDTRAWSFAYDSSGNISTEVDPLGHVQEWTYDAAGRPERQDLPGGRTVSFAHDGGLLTSLTTPSGEVHGFTHDDVGQLTAYTPPDVGLSLPEVRYAYDLDGRVVEIERMDGAVVEYGYDSLGQLDSIQYPEDTVTVSWTDGHPSQISNSATTLSTTWDGSLPISERLVGSGTTSGFDITVGWTWETTQRISAVTVGSDSVAYDYDGDGAVIAAGELLLDYDPVDGALSATSLGVVETTATHDGFGALDYQDVVVVGVTLQQEAYTYDDLGRIEVFSNEAGEAWGYSYTDEGWLEAVTLNDAPWASYQYDGNGNRVEENDGTSVVSSTYDAQDRLLTRGAETFAWADSGELESRTDGSDTTTYQYDALGNLLEVSLPDGTLIGYEVDAKNRRIARTVDGLFDRGFVWQSPLQIAAELDATGSVVSRFVYTDAGNVPAYMEQAGNVYRIVTDARGSVRAVVDADTGEVMQELSYDPWGVVLSDSNPGFQPFGYAGGLYDPDTGLVRFGARDYDAGLGRWLARDRRLPTDAWSLNGYAYANLDPVNYRDSDGEFAQAIPVVPIVVVATAVVVSVWYIQNPPRPTVCPSVGVAPVLMSGIWDWFWDRLRPPLIPPVDPPDGPSPDHGNPDRGKGQGQPETPEGPPDEYIPPGTPRPTPRPPSSPDVFIK